MSLLSTLGGVLAGVVMRRVTTVSADGQVHEKRKVRRPVKALVWLLAFLLLYHLLLWPVLNYLWPEVGFVQIDAHLLGSILTLGL